MSFVVTPENAGRYQCKAHVKSFPELTGYANVYIKAAPSIVSKHIQYVPDEGVVKVCKKIQIHLREKKSKSLKTFF